MTGFLNAHGTSMALYGHFVSLSCETDDDVAALENAGLITFPNVDCEVFEDELDDNNILYCELAKLDNTGRADLMKSPYWDFGVESEPVQYADMKEWYYATMSDEEAERLAAKAAAKMATKEFEAADRYLPSSSSNRTHMYHINWYGEDSDKGHRARRNVNCRQKAKFRIDGKLARKDNRDHRIGNRQKFAGLRDYWADQEMTMWDIYLEGDRDPIIP